MSYDYRWHGKPVTKAEFLQNLREMGSRNPDELIARWHKRQAEKEKVLLLPPEPVVWDIVGGPEDPDHAALILRPWEGEILLSLGTMGSAPQALLRRPWLMEEESGRSDS